MFGFFGRKKDAKEKASREDVRPERVQKSVARNSGGSQSSHLDGFYPGLYSDIPDSSCRSGNGGSSDRHGYGGYGSGSDGGSSSGGNDGGSSGDGGGGCD